MAMVVRANLLNTKEGSYYHSIFVPIFFADNLRTSRNHQFTAYLQDNPTHGLKLETGSYLYFMFLLYKTSLLIAEYKKSCYSY